MGANGCLNLLVPRIKPSGKQTIMESQIHTETNWRTLHWRSLVAAYRNSPYFEYYEDEFKAFFEKDYTHHFNLNVDSITLVCEMLQLSFEKRFSSEYETEPPAIDLRSAWNKQERCKRPVCTVFPKYIQVFSDRHAFNPDLSILDLLFCLGPSSVDYLNNLETTIN